MVMNDEIMQKKRRNRKRGNKFLRCGAKRLLSAFADKEQNNAKSVSSLHAGGEWASAPHSVGIYSHASYSHASYSHASYSHASYSHASYSHAFRSCALVLALLSLALLPLLSLPVHAQAPLASALDKILDAPALKGGVTGAIVCRVADGKTLYAHDADLRLVPASNRKLFTSAAALELLGPEFRVHTDILAAARPDANGVIAGSVYLRGGGDGLLSPADLDALAETLAAAGIKRVEGGVVGDGTRFTDGPYGFGWEWDDFSDEEFPQISGLEINEGVLEVRVMPGQAPGDPVVVTLDPPTGYVPLAVTAQTGAKDAADTCTAFRPWDKNDFVITGTLPLGQTLTQKIPIQNPALLAANLLETALVRHGIAIIGLPSTGSSLPNAVVLASHPSLPLSEYIVRMNKPSDNLLAESLVRELDSAGTYDAGHARETPFFRTLGVDTDVIALVDGCGVGRRNFVTARSVSALLLGMHREKNWPVYFASLPIAGVDGTLRSRMIGTPAQNNVHAKTGTLSQVRALSGYVTGRSGQLYVFSLLMNNFPGNARSAGTVQDQFVEYLAANL
jgi:D-alanyl-D-alanine carboxypeptidase/D-alanyl-D-alanine-endopeptidase (penicillin-binding protein 4)